MTLGRPETKYEGLMTTLSPTVNVTTPACPQCGKTSMIRMSRSQYDMLASSDSPHVQDMFPGWSPDRRELLITGTHPECWDKIFGPEDEDDEPDEELDEDV